MNGDEIFVNHHAPADWRYVYEGKQYIKVGAYEAERCEFVNDEWVVNGRAFDSLVVAYMTLNEEWLRHERSVK